MTELLAPAKLNLALVVGARRPDGKHEVVTVLQRITLADTVILEPASTLEVEGFREDTMVRSALERLAAAAGVEPRWRASIEKRIPVAAGLGGGSSDAAAALRLGNDSLERPLAEHRLHALAAELGADVPFFLTTGPQLGEGDGTILTPLDISQDYWIVLVMPQGGRKASSGAVYKEFDRRGGEPGFDERRAALRKALVLGDLAALPPNDLASSPLAGELVERGAFRADVTGAGPAVYGLFAEEADAVAGQVALAPRGDVWVAGPAW
ncbi:MAG: 4-(cytidine 5'-diphospho)-2-C-methyl-D-erythritol kinase [Actinomycetota bacterium]|nr:4-(cytidine 5'-diphospho)-2-C-methyl-D-erythritol kinase [Actinomycetota bacterium]